MNKRQILFFVGVIVLFAWPIKAKANSDVVIEILEQEMTIRNVVTPKFGSYHLSGKKMTLQSENDLVIEIEDARGNKQTPWQLVYHFTPFSQADKTPPDVLYELGAGHLKERKIATEAKDYQSVSASFVSEKSSAAILSKGSEMRSETLHYEYRVTKNQIQLVVPKNMTAGKYQAKQVIVLQNVPNI